MIDVLAQIRVQVMPHLDDFILGIKMLNSPPRLSEEYGLLTSPQIMRKDGFLGNNGVIIIQRTCIDLYVQ